MDSVLSYFVSAKFFETVIVIIIASLLISGSNAIDRNYLKSKSGNTRWYKSAKIIFDLINSIIVIVLILAILSINGVDVRKYIASLGVIGIILSYALQDLVKDIIMGLSIMFEGYYKIGDVIEIDGKAGKVVSFNVKTTKLFMLDTETTMSICNRHISQVGICSDWIDIAVPIGYDVDLQYARQLCRECARRIERLRHVYSCDFLNTQELAESWVEYKLRIHCLADKKPSVRRNAQAVVQDVFYEKNQEFPLSIKVLYNMEPSTNEKPHKEIVEQEGVVVYESTAHRKRDYELGRGAAKSKEMKYSGSSEDINMAVSEAERYAISENLDNGMKLRIRLLSEELLSLVGGIPEMKSGVFFVEREGSDYEICFDADGKINRKTRDSLVGVSSTNTNEAYVGVSGMIIRAIDSMLLMSSNDKKGYNKAFMNTMEQSIGKADDDYRWSYNIYKEKEQESLAVIEMDSQADIENQNSSIEKDDIVKSVLTNLADDIRISVRTNHVSIRILVKNEEED
ncbi:MAG: mechanosensitive ion channel [Lachnospiraceae bacterium]|nr:mechanosensitive ion channel [Lachnospiraceae bacterium]